MNQLPLFSPFIVRYSDLEADSPRHAYYNIRLEYFGGYYRVCKESGFGRHRLNTRERVFDSLSDAEKHYDRVIRDKTNPLRRSPRKYRPVMLVNAQEI